MKTLRLQARSKSGSEQIPDIYYIPETSWHGIDWAIQIDTTQGGLLLTSQLSIETNKLGL